MNLAEKEAQLSRQLAAFKNGQDRLAYLVELARQRPALAPEYRVEQNLIPGCLAKLWFYPRFADSRCHFACDSDSLVVKTAIVAHDPAFLAPLGITQHLTPNRRNALSKIWDQIKAFAQAHNPPPGQP